MKSFISRTKASLSSVFHHFQSLRTLIFAIPYSIFHGFSIIQQIASKMLSKLQIRSKTAPKSFRNAPKSLPRGSQDTPRTLPRGPKSVPRGPQSTPRAPQEAPRDPQEHPKRHQETPKSAPRSPKTAQDRSHTAQKRPKTAPRQGFDRMSKVIRIRETQVY